MAGEVSPEVVACSSALHHMVQEMTVSKRVSFILNKQPVTITAEPGRRLLQILREDLGLAGTKQGCDCEGECGAYTVLLAGELVVGPDGVTTPLSQVAAEIARVGLDRRVRGALAPARTRNSLTIRGPNSCHSSSVVTIWPRSR